MRKKPDSHLENSTYLCHIVATPGERSFLPLSALSSLPHPRAAGRNKSCPSAAGVDPDPDELVYGPLISLEASHLVRSPIRVDPERPGRKRSGAENFCCFRSQIDQLILQGQHSHECLACLTCRPWRVGASIAIPRPTPRPPRRRRSTAPYEPTRVQVPRVKRPFQVPRYQDT